VRHRSRSHDVFAEAQSGADADRLVGELSHRIETLVNA